MEQRTVEVNIDRINALLGTQFADAQMMDVLTRLDFAPVQTGRQIHVEIPSYRQDISMEADIAEKERKLEEIDTKRQEKKAAMLSFLHRKDNAKDAADAATAEESTNEKADKASSSK